MYKEEGQPMLRYLVVFMFAALAQNSCANAATYLWSWNDQAHPGEIVSGSIDLVEGINDPNTVNFQISHALDPSALGGNWIYITPLSSPAFEVVNGEVKSAGALFQKTLADGYVLTTFFGTTSSLLTKNEGQWGTPVFTLQSSPSTNAVPEPASWMMMIAGLLAVGAALRSRRRRVIGKPA